MLAVLSELVRLCSSDPEFRGIITSTAFVPCSSATNPDEVVLRVPSDVYDPSAPDLLALMDPYLFPLPGPFRTPDVLSALRSLGLQTSMSRGAVKSAAASIDNALRSGNADVAGAVLDRSRRLLSYIDTQSGYLFAYNPVSAARSDVGKGKPSSSGGGFLSRMFGGSTAPQQVGMSAADAQKLAERREAEQIEVVEFVSALRELAWVPVLTEAPVDHLPWPTPASGVLFPLATPSSVRPIGDMWLCSYSRRLLDGTAASPACRWFFDWDEPIPASGSSPSILLCRNGG